MFFLKYKSQLDNLLNFRYIFLIYSFFILYSFFSSNVPRFIEFQHFLMLLTMTILFFLILFENKNFLNTQFYKNNLFFLFTLFILLYGTLIGLINNNSLGNIFRDFISVATLLVFIIINYFRNDKKCIKLIFIALIFCGLIFSIKSLLFNNEFFVKNKINYPHGDIEFVSKYYFLYLENTIVVSLTFFGLKIVEKIKKNKFFKLQIYIFLISFPLYVVLLNVLRGPYLFFIFSIFLYLVFTKRIKDILIIIGFLLAIINFFMMYIFFNLYFFFKKSREFFLFILILSVCIFIIDHIFSDLLFNNSFSKRTNILNILDKFYKAGIFNNRSLEFLEYLKNINFKNSIGFGLGHLIYNPINSSNVLFVHNFLLYFTYKFGFIGILFCLSVYYYFFKKSIFSLINLNNLPNEYSIMFLSLFSSLIYPLFFSSTYKSITFGFVLSLFLILQFQYKNGVISK